MYLRIGKCLLAALGLWTTVGIASVQAAGSTTGLVITASHEARVAPADDGKAHIEYDLIALNEFATPMTLTSVAVLDASGKELMKLEGNALSAVTESAFDQQPLAAIPPSGSAAVLIDLWFRSGKCPRICRTGSPIQ